MMLRDWREIVTDDQLTEASTQIFDACINPLANIMLRFLGMQIDKGMISKEEAKWLIASSVDVLNQANVTDAVREVGGDMLMRMVRAIDDI